MTAGQLQGALNPGQVVSDRYQIQRFLGRGGMASVYVATDLLLNNTQVALKVLHEHLQQLSAQYQRFLREVQLMREVTHPNVVRTYDVGREGDLVYYTMELVSGVSLDKLIGQEGRRLSIERVLRYLLQMCAGLQAIHRCEIVHRDLKPANILIVEHDLVKITDFGVARPKVSELTDDNSFCGTVSYVAPEVFRGEGVTAATDCYSLGVTLYEMLTGRVPFRDDAIARVVTMHVSQLPRAPIELRPDLPAWLNDLVLGLLAKKTSARPSLAQVMRLVGAGLEGHAAPADSGIGPCRIEGSRLPRVTTDPHSLLERTAAEEMRTDFETAPVFEIDRPADRFSLSRLLVVGALAMLVGILHLAVFRSPWGEALEQRVLDIWFPLRGALARPEGVVLVAMDEQSYSNLNVPITEPWPRELHAQLLKRLAEYGVKRVVFDILFLNAGASAEADAAFVEALGTVPVVLGSSFIVAPRSTVNGSFMLEEYLTPYHSFADKAAAIGMVGLPNDYGRIRRFNTEQSERYTGLMSLAAAGAGAYAQERELPGRYDFINYYGPPGTVPSFSYDMIVNPDSILPPEALRDKVVVVGLALHSSAGPMQKEAFQSPYHGDFMFGAEIHATAIANIVQRQWIKRGSPRVESLSLSLVAFFLTMALLIVPPLAARLLCAGCLLLWAAASFNAFLFGAFVPGLLLFVIVLPGTCLITALQRQLAE